jgi:type I restriction enzyme S subunit
MRTTSLGAICRFAAGSAFKPQYQGQISGEWPFIKVSDMNLAGNEYVIRFANHYVTEIQRKEMNAKLHPVGSTVFAKIGIALTTNRRRILVRPTIIDNNMMSATAVESEVTPRFLNLLLKTIDFNTISVGSALPYLNVSDLQKIEVIIPDLKIQRSIVRVIGDLDDKIELNRQTNQTLERIAQTLFKSWFVDFEPVQAKIAAKAAGRDPERAAMCAISGKLESELDQLPPEHRQQLAATVALFPDELVESELGLIPNGWEVGTVADLGEVICGKTPPTADSENYGDDVPFITIPDMHDKLMVTTTSRSLSHKGADTQKKKYLPPGSVCVSCIATPGLVVRVTRKSQTNQQINSVVPYEKWGEEFPLFVLRLIGDRVKAGGSGGSVFHNLSKSGFEQLHVLLCDEKLAQAFNLFVVSVLEHILLNQQQSEALSEIRDSLLPKLLSGEIEVIQVD